MSVSGALQLQVEVELFHQSLQLFSPAVPAAIATLAERALTDGCGRFPQDCPSQPVPLWQH